MIVYEHDGTFVTAWGEGIFARTHCIRLGLDGAAYVVDDEGHTFRKFTHDGKQLMVLGTPGVASDTGYVREKGASSISHGGPPFNRPTGIALAPNGDLYVSDGYGNARVHRFTADGRLINPGVSPAPGLASSTCPTTYGWHPTSAFSWLTGKTIKFRS